MSPASRWLSVIWLHLFPALVLATLWHGYVWLRRVLALLLYDLRLGLLDRKAAWTKPRANVVADVPYKESSSSRFHQLDVYIPRQYYTPPAPQYQPGPASFPVMFYIHGGMFRGGSKTLTHRTAQWFSHRPYIRSKQSDRAADPNAKNSGPFVVFSINYRLSPPHTLYDALLDVCQAYLWVLTHAKDYGGDQSRLVIAADEAGANLAMALVMCLCYRRAEDKTCSFLFDHGTVPSCVLLHSGLFGLSDLGDCHSFVWESRNVRKGKELVQMMLQHHLSEEQRRNVFWVQQQQQQEKKKTKTRKRKERRRVKGVIAAWHDVLQRFYQDDLLAAVQDSFHFQLDQSPAELVELDSEEKTEKPNEEHKEKEAEVEAEAEEEEALDGIKSSGQEEDEEEDEEEASPEIKRAMEEINKLKRDAFQLSAAEEKSQRNSLMVTDWDKEAAVRAALSAFEQDPVLHHINHCLNRHQNSRSPIAHLPERRRRCSIHSKDPQQQVRCDMMEPLRFFESQRAERPSRPLPPFLLGVEEQNPFLYQSIRLFAALCKQQQPQRPSTTSSPPSFSVDGEEAKRPFSPTTNTQLRIYPRTGGGGDGAATSPSFMQSTLSGSSFLIDSLEFASRCCQESASAHF